MKYNFRIYTCGYDLKVKSDDKIAFFKLSSGDVKETVSDQKIKNFLIEEIGVSGLRILDFNQCWREFTLRASLAMAALNDALTVESLLDLPI